MPYFSRSRFPPARLYILKQTSDNSKPQEKNTSRFEAAMLPLKDGGAIFADCDCRIVSRVVRRSLSIMDYHAQVSSGPGSREIRKSKARRRISNTRLRHNR